MRLAGVLGTFWYMHSHSDEGRKWLEAALARDEGAPLAVRIRALEALYWLAFDRWDHERAEAIASEAMELSAEAEIQSSLAASLRVMSAGPAWGLGDTERERRSTKRAPTCAGRRATLSGSPISCLAWATNCFSKATTRGGGTERGGRRDLPGARVQEKPQFRPGQPGMGDAVARGPRPGQDFLQGKPHGIQRARRQGLRLLEPGWSGLHRRGRG